ncbi:hypothetical protein F5884DRAFT_875818 [Xylogone sp. PMI_703]|nr:hypothetical protein F5884DRAFT_875818 [Xylogone sp. PMI_703]
MGTPKLIVIVGATGNQGGSVCRTFTKDPAWKVRGITRNISSSKAQALKDLGIEVVQADVDNVSSLVEAFKGANTIFLVSDFWGKLDNPENVPNGVPSNRWAYNYELQQIKNMIDAAAKIESLERLIYSSLSNASKWSKGKYTNVLHFDSKAFGADYGAEKYPELWKKTSIVQAGWFISNYVSNPIIRPTKNAKGVVQFTSHANEDLYLPFFAAEEDMGPLTKALVEEKPGKNLIAYRKWMTMKQFAELFAQVVGRPAEYVALPIGQWHIPIPKDIAEELDDNFGYWNEFGYEARDDPTVIHPRDLETPVELDTVKNYIKKQDWSFLDA